MKAMKSRIGETRKNHQGLIMRIVEYVNNKNIIIEFIETGERRKTTYLCYKRGMTTANLRNYPPYLGCSRKQASYIFAILVSLFLAGIGALIYSII